MKTWKFEILWFVNVLITSNTYLIYSLLNLIFCSRPRSKAGRSGNEKDSTLYLCFIFCMFLLFHLFYVACNDLSFKLMLFYFAICDFIVNTDVKALYSAL